MLFTRSASKEKMNYFNLNLSLAAGTAAVIFLGTGCATERAPVGWQQPPQGEHETVQRDPLSYGAVTATVKKGETTQEDIIRLFGSPNITTINAGSDEIWVYDRISNTSQHNGWSEARRFRTYFGLGPYESDEATASSKTGTGRESSTRTLTVIITFDSVKKVKDYSTRATQF